MSIRAKFAFFIILAMVVFALATVTLIWRALYRNFVTNIEIFGGNVADNAALILDERSRVIERATQLYSDGVRASLFLNAQTIKRLAESGGVSPSDALRQADLAAGASVWAVDGGMRLVLQRGMTAENPQRFSDADGTEIGSKMAAVAKRQKQPVPAMIRNPETGKEFPGCHFWLEHPGWLVGVWTDPARYAAMRQTIFDENIEVLRWYIGNVSMGGSGYIFLIGPRGAIVQGPDPRLSSSLTAKNPMTGNVLLDDIHDAARRDRSFLAMLDTPEGVERTRIFAQHIPAFDCYVVCVWFPMRVSEPIRRAGWWLGLATLGLAAATAAAGLWYAGKLTRPLERLGDFARGVPDADFFAQPDAGERRWLTSLAHGGGKDELQKLANAFLFMDDTLRARVRELVTETGVRERLAGELDGARDIQKGILPEPLGEEASRGRFTLGTFLEPAREVGGDLYDCFMVDDDHLCLAIGDVSGKGSRPRCS